MHKFPPDASVKSEWLRRINRKDFHPTKNSRVCSKHFVECDFIDSNASRAKKKGACLNIKYLKTDAVPAVFPSQKEKFFPRRATKTSDSGCVERNIKLFSSEKYMHLLFI